MKATIEGFYKENAAALMTLASPGHLRWARSPWAAPSPPRPAPGRHHHHHHHYHHLDQVIVDPPLPVAETVPCDVQRTLRGLNTDRYSFVFIYTISTLRRLSTMSNYLLFTLRRYLLSTLVDIYYLHFLPGWSILASASRQSAARSPQSKWEVVIIKIA